MPIDSLPVLRVCVYVYVFVFAIMIAQSGNKKNRAARPRFYFFRYCQPRAVFKTQTKPLHEIGFDFQKTHNTIKFNLMGTPAEFPTLLQAKKVEKHFLWHHTPQLKCDTLDNKFRRGPSEDLSSHFSSNFNRVSDKNSKEQQPARKTRVHKTSNIGVHSRSEN